MASRLYEEYLQRVATYSPWMGDGGWYFDNPKGEIEGPFETRDDALAAEDWWHA